MLDEPDSSPSVELRDLTLFPGEIATLRPEVSDPDGDIVGYAWTLLVTPPLSGVVLADPTAVEVSFTPDKLGSYVLELEVEVADGPGLVPLTAVVTILDGTERPTVDAGPDRIVAAEFPTLLKHEGDDSFVYYEWLLTEAPDESTLTFRSFEPVVTFVPDVVGEFRLELTVHDGNLASVPDEVVLDVRANEVDLGDVSGGTLLPSQVYVYGPVVGCQNGVAHWADLDTVMGAVDSCSGVDAIEMEHNGDLLYLRAGVLRRLVCDDCPGWTGTKAKGDVTENDIVVDTAPCDGKTAGLPTDLQPGADGSLLLLCDNQWYVQGKSDKPLTTAASPMTFDGQLVYLSNNELLDVDTRLATPVPELAFGGVRVARTVNDGFHVVTFADELWHVDATTAKGTLLGSYPQPGDTFMQLSALDANDALIFYIFDFDDQQYRLGRRRLDGVNDGFANENTRLTTPWALLTAP